MKIIFLILFFFFIIRVFLFFSLKPHLSGGQHITVITTLTDDPLQYSRYNLLFANYANFWGYEKFMAIYPRNVKLGAGDTVTVSGTLSSKVIEKSVMKTLYFPQIEARILQRNNILALFSHIRQKMKDVYYHNLSKEYASFLFGIIVGGKENFTRTFIADLQTTGVVHVVSASGFSVTMVAGFLFATTAWIFRRQLAVGISIIGVLSYMLLAGAQAPVLRAGIMSIFAFSAQLFGRQYTRFYGLLFAAFSLLFWDPGLSMDAGFQLTFMATLGIMAIKPLFPKHPVFDDIAVTFSAQIATLPITLSTFGVVGITSFFVNFLVMWTIPPLMILGSFASLGIIFPPIGVLFTLLCQPFLWWFMETVKFFGGLGWNIEVSSLPASVVVGYYLIVGSVWLFLLKNLKR